MAAIKERKTNRKEQEWHESTQQKKTDIYRYTYIETVRKEEEETEKKKKKPSHQILVVPSLFKALTVRAEGEEEKEERERAK